MMNDMIKKIKKLGLIGLMGLMGLTMTNCSDEPDSEYFYTFTGEMMSD